MPALNDTHGDMRLPARAFGSAVLGGVLGWTLLFAGLQSWGLVIGAAATVGTMTAFARLRISSHAFRVMAGYGFAFVLLTWPILWITVGFVRYLLTGQSLGN